MLTQQRNEYKFESIIDFILYGGRLRELVRNEKVIKSPDWKKLSGFVKSGYWGKIDNGIKIAKRNWIESTIAERESKICI